MFVSLISLLFLLLIGGALVLVVALLAKALGKRGVLAVLGMLGMVAVFGIFAALFVRVQARNTALVNRSNSRVNTYPTRAPMTNQLPGEDVVRLQGSDASVSVGEDGVRIQTPKAGVSVRPDGVSVQVPGVNGDVLKPGANGDVLKAEVDASGPRVSVTPESWTPSDQHAFEASVYPSASSAVVALSRAIIKKQLADVMPVAMPLDRLLVNGTAEPRILATLQRELRSALPTYSSGQLSRMEPEAQRLYGLDEGNQRGRMFQALRARRGTEIRIQSPATTQPEAGQLQPWEAQLAINVTPNGTGEPAGSGRVEVTLAGSVGEVSWSTEYVDAPWAENFTRWREEHRGHQWILGTSEQLCATEAEAKQQALDAVVAELQRRLDEFVSDPQRGYSEFRGSRDPGWVRNQLAIDLRDNRFSQNAFFQGFPRPYGTVYRAAVLVDASPAQLAQVAEKYWQHVEIGRKRDLNLLASSAGLILVICVVYLFLNAATRGYYVWSMRAAAVVLASVGVVALLKYM